MKKFLLNSLHHPALFWKTRTLNHSAASALKSGSIRKFSLEETQGRPWKLFHSPSSTAIASCVSCDFQMDKGVAKQFLKQYGNFEELKEKGLDFPKGQKVGKIGVLRTRERCIYYLITREKWWDKASYTSMEECLLAMQNHCIDNNIKKLAIPRLGAQCDRLLWDKVKDLIVDIFQNSSIDITAYSHR